MHPAFLRKFTATTVLILVLVLTLGVATSHAMDLEDDIPAKAGADWNVGFRAGAEIHTGEIEQREYSLAPAFPTGFEELFVGPNMSAYIERTITDHVSLGAEIGWADSTIGELSYERDFITLYYGPYLRATLRPGRVSPFIVAAPQIYHAFAKGLGGTNPFTFQPTYPLRELNNPVGFSYALGGGIEFPLTVDYTFAIESRYRQYLQGGTDPKVIELFLVIRAWVY